MMTNDRNSPDNAIGRRSRELLEQGYCIIPDLMTRERIAALDDELGEDFAETPFCTGGFYGARTKRFGRLLARSGIAAELVQHALVLGVVRTVHSGRRGIPGPIAARLAERQRHSAENPGSVALSVQPPPIPAKDVRRKNTGSKCAEDP